VAGLGFVLALCADIRFCTADSKWTTAFAKRGKPDVSVTAGAVQRALHEWDRAYVGTGIHTCDRPRETFPSLACHVPLHKCRWAAMMHDASF
jgi:hypothetical protein